MKRGARKFLAYFVTLALLVAAALVANEVRQTREVIRNPQVSTLSAPRAAPTGDAENPSEPPAGKEKSWSVDDLAWALKERIVLDILEDFAASQPEIDAYNERVTAYNKRASLISYKESDMAAAVRLVESQKEEIVRAALREASAAPKLPHGDAAFERVWRAQSYLRAMGYYLGTVDGEMNGDTEYAIMNYQVHIETGSTGTIDEALLLQLEESLTIRYTPEEVGFNSAPEEEIE